MLDVIFIGIPVPHPISRPDVLSAKRCEYAHPTASMFRYTLKRSEGQSERVGFARNGAWDGPVPNPFGGGTGVHLLSRARDLRPPFSPLRPGVASGL